MIDNRHIAPHFVFFEVGDTVRFVDWGVEKIGTVVAVSGDQNNWQGKAHIQTGELGGGDSGEEPCTWIYLFTDLISWL